MIFFWGEWKGVSWYLRKVENGICLNWGISYALVNINKLNQIKGFRDYLRFSNDSHVCIQTVTSSRIIHWIFPFFLHQKIPNKNQKPTNLLTTFDRLKNLSPGRFFVRTIRRVCERWLPRRFRASKPMPSIISSSRSGFPQWEMDSTTRGVRFGHLRKKKKSIKKTRVTPYTGIILPSCGNYVVVISCFFQDFYWRLVKYDHFTWEFCDLVYGIVIWATERYERLSFPKDVKHSTNMVSYKVSNLYSTQITVQAKLSGE